MSVSPDAHHHDTSEEPLLLPALIAQYRGGVDKGGGIAEIVRSLLDSPRTDAERAGERLRVFGFEREGRPGALTWDYRVIGEETGREHVAFTLTVPDAPSDLPCRVLGLQLQITLNGIERTPPEELDCYLELAEFARDEQ
jgi:hypothetical protein